MGCCAELGETATGAMQGELEAQLAGAEASFEVGCLVTGNTRQRNGAKPADAALSRRGRPFAPTPPSRADAALTRAPPLPTTARLPKRSSPSCST